jgi:hypothetical protein
MAQRPQGLLNVGGFFPAGSWLSRGLLRVWRALFRTKAVAINAVQYPLKLTGQRQRRLFSGGPRADASHHLHGP